MEKKRKERRGDERPLHDSHGCSVVAVAGRIDEQFGKSSKGMMIIPLDPSDLLVTVAVGAVVIFWWISGAVAGETGGVGVGPGVSGIRLACPN